MRVLQSGSADSLDEAVLLSVLSHVSRGDLRRRMPTPARRPLGDLP